MKTPIKSQKWNFIVLLVGISLIWSGCDVIQTGVLLNAEIRGGVIVKAGEYANPIGTFFIIVGLWLFLAAIRAWKK